MKKNVAGQLQNQDLHEIVCYASCSYAVFLSENVWKECQTSGP